MTSTINKGLNNAEGCIDQEKLNQGLIQKVISHNRNTFMWGYIFGLISFFLFLNLFALITNVIFYINQ